MVRDVEILISRRIENGAPIRQDRSNLNDVFGFWVDFFRQAASYDNADMVNALLLEPLTEGSQHLEMVYQPCHLIVHPERGVLDLRTVCSSEGSILDSTASPLPNIPTEWSFSGEMVHKAIVSQSNPTSLYLFVEASHFQLYLPSVNICTAFYTSISALRTDLGSTSFEEADFECDQVEFDVDLRDQKRIKLGEGAFGCVYQGTHRTNNLKVAIKEVIVRRPEDLQLLMEEIKMHRGWKDDHIVQCYGCNLDKERNVFRVYMEQVPGGSLASMLPVPEKIWAQYTEQILKGLVYLHKRKVVHCDIKCSNVLVNMYRGTLLLSDFGTSRRLSGLNDIGGETLGTYRFMAPEVFYSQRGYGLPADIWSLGCTLVEMITGEVPFNKHVAVSAMYMMVTEKIHPKIPENVPDACKAFLLKCFQHEQSMRPTAEQLLKDDFITWRYRSSRNKAHKHLPPQMRMPVSNVAPEDSMALGVRGRSTSVPDFVEPDLLQTTFDVTDVHANFIHQATNVLRPETEKPDIEKIKKDVLGAFYPVLRDQQDAICSEWQKALCEKAQLRPSNNVREPISNILITKLFLFLSPLVMLELPTVSKGSDMYLYMEQLSMDELQAVKQAIMLYDTVISKYLRSNEFADIKIHSIFIILSRIGCVQKAAAVALTSVMTHKAKCPAALRRAHTDARPEGVDIPELADAAQPQSQPQQPSPHMQQPGRHPKFGSAGRSISLVEKHPLTGDFRPGHCQSGAVPVTSMPPIVATPTSSNGSTPTGFNRSMTTPARALVQKERPPLQRLSATTVAAVEAKTQKVNAVATDTVAAADACVRAAESASPLSCELDRSHSSPTKLHSPVSTPATRLPTAPPSLPSAILGKQVQPALTEATEVQSTLRGAMADATAGFIDHPAQDVFFERLGSMLAAHLSEISRLVTRTGQSG
jgi:serine/threonine protein kinase